MFKARFLKPYPLKEPLPFTPKGLKIEKRIERNAVVTIPLTTTSNKTGIIKNGHLEN